MGGTSKGHQFGSKFQIPICNMFAFDQNVGLGTISETTICKKMLVFISQCDSKNIGLHHFFIHFFFLKITPVFVK